MFRGSGPTKRRTPRPKNPYESDGEGFGGSGQDDSFPPPGDVLSGLASNCCSAHGFPPLGDVPVNEAPAGAAPARTVLGRDRPKSNALVPVDIFLHAADKSSDILEVDVESLDDNILEGAGATLGTGELGSGRTHTHYPGSGQLRWWRLLTHLTMQLLSPVQHVQ